MPGLVFHYIDGLGENEDDPDGHFDTFWASTIDNDSFWL